MHIKPQNPLIKLTKFNISIQASKHHYCTPRKDLDDMNDYTHVEIALFTKNNDWINPHTSPLLIDFPRLEELLANYENSNTTSVGYNIPADLVHELVQFAT